LRVGGQSYFRLFGLLLLVVILIVTVLREVLGVDIDVVEFTLSGLVLEHDGE